VEENNKCSKTEEIKVFQFMDFKGKHGEIRTALGKQKRNAHLTTAIVIAKEYNFSLASTENLKQDPCTA